MPTYIIGRDQVTTAPGVLNDNIRSVSLTVQGNEQDVTVFKSTALTQMETMIGLVEISFEVNCTATTATVGMSGAFVVGNLDGDDMEIVAEVTDVKRTTTPKGVDEFSVSYSVRPS